MRMNRFSLVSYVVVVGTAIALGVCHRYATACLLSLVGLAIAIRELRRLNRRQTPVARRLTASR